MITGVHGEHHQLGANMVADLLESDGWDVRFLGANVPPDSVLEAVVEHRATLVGISAATLPSLPRVRSLIERLRQAHAATAPPPAAPLRVLVGGCLFRSHPDLWREAGADGSTAELREVAQLARGPADA